jgi:hypothetical protein
MLLGSPEEGAEHGPGERDDPTTRAVNESLVDQVSDQRLELVVP